MDEARLRPELTVGPGLEDRWLDYLQGPPIGDEQITVTTTPTGINPPPHARSATLHVDLQPIRIRFNNDPAPTYGIKLLPDQVARVIGQESLVGLRVVLDANATGDGMLHVFYWG